MEHQHLIVLPSAEQVKTYLCFPSVLRQRDTSGEKRKEKKLQSSCSGSLLLRANDKFSDNRRVLIDVSAPVSRNHQ